MSISISILHDQLVLLVSFWAVGLSFVPLRGAGLRVQIWIDRWDKVDHNPDPIHDQTVLMCSGPKEQKDHFVDTWDDMRPTIDISAYSVS